jgi:hypothetical protein
MDQSELLPGFANISILKTKQPTYCLRICEVKMQDQFWRKQELFTTSTPIVEK